MNISPYRIDSDESARAFGLSESPDRDLRAVLVIFWISSLLRVAFGLYTQETFGSEATLAFLVVLALPVLLLRARV